MSLPSRIALITGISILLLSVFNGIVEPTVSPGFVRAELLAGISAIGMFLVAIVWSIYSPDEKKKVNLNGNQGLEISVKLEESIKQELAWGSHLILTATAASTILVYFNGEVLLRRGLISHGDSIYVPGDIANRARQTQDLISLVSTKFFPGKAEFEPILENLPSLIIYPLKESGWVIVGGWSERCFTASDEKWIVGWSDRLFEMLVK